MQRREWLIWTDFFRGKFTTTLAAFLLQRYAAQIAAWAAFAFLFGEAGINCQALVSTVYGTNVVFAAAVSYIFAQRTFALYDFHRLVVIGLYTLWAGLIACYIIVAAQYRAVRLPIAFEGCNCAITSAGKISLLGFAASLVFDLVVLVLTLGRLYYLRLKSQLGDTIRSTSITYFAAVSTVNLALVLIIAISNNPTINATPLGPAFAVTYLLLNRMIFGMRDRSRVVNKASVGMGTEHLEQYRKDRKLSRSGNGIRGISGIFARSGSRKLGSGIGSQPSDSLVRPRSGSGEGGPQSAPMENGIPMTVTVAQNSEAVQADPDAEENLFAHLRTQAYSSAAEQPSHIQHRNHYSKSSSTGSAGSHSQKDYVSAAAHERQQDLEAGDGGEMKPYGPFYNS